MSPKNPEMRRVTLLVLECDWLLRPCCLAVSAMNKEGKSKLLTVFPTAKESEERYPGQK